MKPYITIAAPSLAELEEMVGEQIIEGYVPEGSVSLLALRYVQVMVSPRLIEAFAYNPKRAANLNPVPDQPNKVAIDGSIFVNAGSLPDQGQTQASVEKPDGEGTGKDGR